VSRLGSGVVSPVVAAEELVLSSILNGPRIGVDPLATALDLGLAAAHFTRPEHAAIFDACLDVERSDEVAVANRLERAGNLDAVGGLAELRRLQNLVGTVAIARHVRTILEAAWWRDATSAVHALADAVERRNRIAFGDGIDRLDRLAGEAAPGQLDVSWQPIDLAAVLNGNLVRPAPNVLHRTDGRALFYGGMVNGLHGDSGVGKGWVVLHAIAGELAEGGRVLLVDLEDVAEAVAARLHDIGVSAALVAEGLDYRRPQVPFDGLAVRELTRVVRDRGVTLAVVDSLGEAFGLEGVDENKDAEVGPWLRRVARVIAEAGAAVLLVDHATKAADNPLHPSGSKRKRAAIGGASYLVEAVVPLVRGEGGRLRLTCAKDRHGNYRRGETVAELVMTCHGDSTRLELYPPKQRANVAAELPAILVAREVVRLAKESTTPLTKRALLGLIKVKASQAIKLSGIALACDFGAVAIDAGRRGAHLVRYVHDLDTDLGL
jgi:hypothetical protein